MLTRYLIHRMHMVNQIQQKTWYPLAVLLHCPRSIGQGPIKKQAMQHTLGQTQACQAH